MYPEARAMDDPYDIHSRGISDHSAVIAEVTLSRKSMRCREDPECSCGSITSSTSNGNREPLQHHCLVSSTVAMQAANPQDAPAGHGLRLYWCCDADVLRGPTPKRLARSLPQTLRLRNRPRRCQMIGPVLMVGAPQRSARPRLRNGRQNLVALLVAAQIPPKQAFPPTSKLAGAVRCAIAGGTPGTNAQVSGQMLCTSHSKTSRRSRRVRRAPTI